MLASRPSDELIEAIPFVAHLSNQVMKRVADFGEAKFSDEQKAEFALDGLSLGEQLAKEAIPKLVKESILVALGTDSVDARNRMLMAAKKIAANLVELAKYAAMRFASKGAAPTEEEAEEAEIISGSLKASMGILMDTATGLKEGRREIFARSPSPRHRRTPSGIGLGGGAGSSGNLGTPRNQYWLACVCISSRGVLAVVILLILSSLNVTTYFFFCVPRKQQR